jgi:hypothetical protein
MREEIVWNPCKLVHFGELHSRVYAICDDDQCRRFDKHGHNAGIGRFIIRSKNISDVSLVENESENDQRCEYDIDESRE